MSANVGGIGPAPATQTVSNPAVTDGTQIAKVHGTQAAAAAVTNNPVTTGGRAKTTQPTAVTDGQQAYSLYDKLGKQVVVSSLRALKGRQVTTITASTSETTIVTADAANVNDLHYLLLTNSSATPIIVTIKDGTAGSTAFTLAVPATATVGFALTESAAAKQAAANTNWTATSSASVTSLFITALYVANVA